MQRYCTELTERLLKSLDKEYNVVDMGAVVDVITALEKTTITKEVLEITRLGKYINELRRKTSNDALAKRAKDLVRRWRDMVLPSAHATPQPTPADTAPQALNGTKPQSPALRGLKPQSPALRALKPQSPALKNLKPHSPLMRDTTPLKQVLSPALSLHSDHSRSPNPTPTKQQQSQASLGATATRTSNTTNHHRLNSDVTSGKLLPVTTLNNSQIEAVPRTHSSNKRLRKEEETTIITPVDSPENKTPPLTSSTTSVKTFNRGDSNDSLASRLEPLAKRPRLNGEITNFGNLSKYSDSYASNNNIVAGRGSSNLSSSRSLNQQVPSPRDAHDNKSTTTTTTTMPPTTTTTTTASERLSSSEKVSTSLDSSRDVNDSSLAPTGPKKRGRKKGSKSLKNQNLPEDRVKEKLASISRNPKLKTTQELLADLQARGSSLTSASPTSGDHQQRIGENRNTTDPPTTKEILRNDERSLSSRYLRSTIDKTSSLKTSKNFTDSTKSRTKINTTISGGNKKWQSAIDDPEESQNEDNNEDATKNRELTVEEILAKLPPLDVDAICWSDEEQERRDFDDDDEESNERDKVKEISREDVDRLHGECIEGLNGNFQFQINLSPGKNNDNDVNSMDCRKKDDKIEDIRNEEPWSIGELKKKGVYRRLGPNDNKDNREFREWHEMLAKPSYDGQTLHILPYVIID